MSSRAASTIAYGVVFLEGTEFPWGDVGFKEWMLKIDGFKPSIDTSGIFDDKTAFCERTTNQELIDNREKERMLDIEKITFRQNVPCRIELLSDASCDCGGTAICIKHTVKGADRGNGFFEIDKEMRSSFFQLKEDDRQDLIGFMVKHISPWFKENDPEEFERNNFNPKWIWSCFYG